MALLVCDDCGHKVSDLAVACPQCGRPTSTFKSTEAVRSSPREFRAATASSPGSAVTPDTATQPVVQAAWLGDLKKARELPSGVKVCKQCGADVAVDAFRQKVGGGYLCSDCLDEGENRRRMRGEFFTRILVTLGILLIAGAVTAGAIKVIPMLQTSKSVKTAK